MKRLICAVMVLLVVGVSGADTIIVCLYHKGSNPWKVATVWDVRKSTMDDILSFKPANRELWAISSDHRVFDDVRKNRWTGKIDVSSDVVRTGAIGDSLHTGNADSLAVYRSRWKR